MLRWMEFVVHEPDTPRETNVKLKSPWGKSDTSMAGWNQLQCCVPGEQVGQEWIPIGFWSPQVFTEQLPPVPGGSTGLKCRVCFLRECKEDLALLVKHGVTRALMRHRQDQGDSRSLVFIAWRIRMGLSKGDLKRVILTLHSLLPPSACIHQFIYSFIQKTHLEGLPCAGNVLVRFSSS